MFKLRLLTNADHFRSSESISAAYSAGVLARGCCAADKRDELAAFHSITSSARASSVGGT
jgi:hypothetical protein